MRFFATAVHRVTRTRGVAVWQLRYRLRGWNGQHRDPVLDARWALGQAARQHPGVPVILIGHSMGGRTALYVSADPAVVAVCALAPWIEPIDPVDHLAGKLVVIAHGDRDQMTDPGTSRRYALRAAQIGALVAQFDVVGDAHAMLKRPADWHALAQQTVLLALPASNAASKSASDAASDAGPNPGDGSDADSDDGSGGQLATVLAEPQDERFGIPLAAAPEASTLVAAIPGVLRREMWTHAKPTPGAAA